MDFDLAGLSWSAHSVAGIGTCLALPAWRLCFDIGRCTPRIAARCRTILVTHGHVDHRGSLAHHVSLRAMQRMPPTRLIVEATEVPRVEALLEAWRDLARSELPCEVVGVVPGETVSVGKGLTAQAFRASHRVPTLGYGLWQTRSQLRPDFVGRPGPELAAMRAAGEVLTIERRVLRVAFTGDTRAVVLAREPWLREAELLVIECTFLDEDGARERADRTGHVSLLDLVDHAQHLGDGQVLLTHFSTRYSAARVREALDRCLPAPLRARVTPLVAEEAG